jgi:hypothetical protein
MTIASPGVVTAPSAPVEKVWYYRYGGWGRPWGRGWWPGAAIAGGVVAGAGVGSALAAPYYAPAYGDPAGCWRRDVYGRWFRAC